MSVMRKYYFQRQVMIARLTLCFQSNKWDSNGAWRELFSLPDKLGHKHETSGHVISTASKVAIPPYKYFITYSLVPLLAAVAVETALIFHCTPTPMGPTIAISDLTRMQI